MCNKYFFGVNLFYYFIINISFTFSGSEHNYYKVISFYYSLSDMIKFLWFLSWKKIKFYDLLLLELLFSESLFGKSKSYTALSINVDLFEGTLTDPP